jgi:hypothetical protein
MRGPEALQSHRHKRTCAFEGRLTVCHDLVVEIQIGAERCRNARIALNHRMGMKMPRWPGPYVRVGVIESVILKSTFLWTEVRMRPSAVVAVPSAEEPKQGARQLVDGRKWLKPSAILNGRPCYKSLLDVP